MARPEHRTAKFGGPAPRGEPPRDDEEEWPDYDVLLREAVRIAADWVEMLDDKGKPAAGTETAAARPAVAE